MEPGAMRLRCACGWETIGSEPELIAATEEHGRSVHNMVPTRDEILAMVIPSDPPPAGGEAETARRS
jgi:predicted small metal-binding protein